MFESRLVLLDTATLEQPAKANVDALAGMLGGHVPNLHRAMAHAPKALHGYMHLEEQLRLGSVSGALGELVALAIAEHNGCDYCLGAHTKIAGFMKVTSEQAEQARRGIAQDAKSQAVLDVTNGLLKNKGRITDYQLAQAKSAGVTEAELVEIVCHIGAHTISNYMSRLAQFSPDFFEPVQASANG